MITTRSSLKCRYKQSVVRYIVINGYYCTTYACSGLQSLTCKPKASDYWCSYEVAIISICQKIWYLYEQFALTIKFVKMIQVLRKFYCIADEIIIVKWVLQWPSLDNLCLICYFRFDEHCKDDRALYYKNIDHRIKQRPYLAIRKVIDDKLSSIIFMTNRLI